MRRPLSAFGLLAGVLLASWVGSSADATPIGPSCGSCAGAVFDLTHSVSPVATTATTETWAITYTADLSTYSGGGSFLDAVAFKVTGGSNFVTASLVSAPGGVVKWLEVTGGINAMGCSGNGAGFECAKDILPADAAPVSGGPYTWVWNVEVKTGTLLTGTNQASIKARFVDAYGNKKGPLLSEDITLGNTTPSVPEPGIALLVALGTLVAVTRSRTR